MATLKRHGQEISSKRIVAHYSKPSRDARMARRWKARVEQCAAYQKERDYGATVGRFISVRCHRENPDRAFRIAEYLFALFARSQRQQMKAA